MYLYDLNFSSVGRCVRHPLTAHSQLAGECWRYTLNKAVARGGGGWLGLHRFCAMARYGGHGDLGLVRRFPTTTPTDDRFLGLHRE